MKNKKNIALICIIVLIVAIVIALIAMIIMQVTGGTPRDTLQNQFNNEQVGNEITGSGSGEDIPEIQPNTEIPTNQETIASSYYYNQLDDNAKMIYDGLKREKDNLLTGNYTIDFDSSFNTLLHEEDGEEKLNTAFQSAWNAFYYDNVDVFYVEPSKLVLTTEYEVVGGIGTYKVTLGNGENTNYLKGEITTAEEARSAVDYIQGIKEEVVELVKGFDDYNKILIIHNWLIDNLQYDTELDSEHIYDIYGALNHASAVCEGYARAFKYILDGLNIPTVLVSGTATDTEGKEESHMWNYVQVNNRWYAIDLTWDDPIIQGNGELTDELRYQYFMKGSDEFLTNHEEDGNLSENSMKFTFPTLNKENYQQE